MAEEASREELRSAALLLIEATSSLALAIGDVRGAVLVLQHIVAGNAPSGDPHALVKENLAEAMQSLGMAFDSLDAAGKTLGTTDD